MAEYKNPHAMTADAFRGWRLFMYMKRGWRIAECVEALGCGKNAVAEWSKKGAPHYIALACAAIADEVEPWLDTEEDIDQM